MTGHRDSFPQEVADQLGWYVYRLIDPRNGETFYVGKGKGNRVFEHVIGALAGDGDESPSDLKVQRIKDIRAANLEVMHLIHRHKIENAALAYQIEAALIDAYPGLTNKVKGHDSGDYGVRHVEQLISEYLREPFTVLEPLILISIGQSFEDESIDIYQAVRAAWRIDLARARLHKLVLAHRRGIVVGAIVHHSGTPLYGRTFPA